MIFIIREGIFLNIILGTAQIGMDYGITNINGKINKQEVREILDFCCEKNICFLDTAPAYGESEQILGENNLSSFDIITKISAIPRLSITIQEVIDVEKLFFQSLKKMKRPDIYGVLIHSSFDLMKKGSELLIDKLIKWKEEGYVHNIGVSVYDPEEVDFILENFDFDCIQLPLNIFDQRFLQMGILNKIKKRNIDVYVRSIFLQGILLQDREKMENIFSKKVQGFLEYEKFLKEKNLSPLEATLSFIYQIEEIQGVVIGINSFQQLKEICETIENIKQADRNLDFSHLHIDDKTIIDPRTW